MRIHQYVPIVMFVSALSACTGSDSSYKSSSQSTPSGPIKSEIYKLAIPADSASKVKATYYNDSVGYGYVITEANIYSVNASTGAVQMLIDQNPDGDDLVGDIFAYDSVQHQILHGCKISATAHKLCRSYASVNGGPIDTTEIVSNISGNTTTNDDLKEFVLDSTRGLFYFGAGTNFYRLSQSHTNSAKITSADALLSNSTGIYTPRLIQNTGDVYLLGAGHNGGSYGHFLRIDATVTSANKIAISPGTGLNYTRVHSNQWGGPIYVDQVREMVYFTSPTSIWSQLFRMDVNNTSANQVGASDALESTMSSDSNAFVALGASDTNDVLYISAYGGTANHLKLFRMNSSITSGTPLAAADALSDTNSGGSDGLSVDLTKYDAVHKILYFAAEVGTGKKLFRVTDAQTSANKVTAADAISDFVNGGDDAITALNVDESSGNVFLVADDGSGNKKIHIKTAAQDFSGVLASGVGGQLNFNAGGDDAPSILSFDQTQKLMLASVTTSSGDTELVAVPTSDSSDSDVVSNATIIDIVDGASDNADWASTLTSEVSVVRADDESGQPALYVIKFTR